MSIQTEVTRTMKLVFTKISRTNLERVRAARLHDVYTVRTVGSHVDHAHLDSLGSSALALVFKRTLKPRFT